MSDVNFVIPRSKEELLEEGSDDCYCVKDVVIVRELQSKLRDAKNSCKGEGSEFIFNHFDTYFSVLHHGDSLQTELVMKAFLDLHKSVEILNNNVGFLLEDKESVSEELQRKFLNVIKMLLYVYTKVVLLIEKHKDKQKMLTAPAKNGKKRSDDDDAFIGYEPLDVVVKLSNIVQREIGFFWHPEVVEDTFVSMIAEVLYRFLENPQVKSSRELRTDIFGVLGMLVQSYHHGLTFIVRMVQMIKKHEHLVHCVPEGIQLLVTKYNCKNLVRDFVREITEWQTNEKYQDGQGTKNCSAILVEMAALMPKLMVPEIMYLNNFLEYESYMLRNSVLAVIVEVVLTVLTKHDLSEEEKESRDDFLSILEEHTADESAHVRTRVFQHWSRLQTNNAVPRKMQYGVLEKAIAHLRDKAALVRKAAAACVTTFLTHNLYGAKLQMGELKRDLEGKESVLNVAKEKVQRSQQKRIDEIEGKWAEMEPDIRSVMEELMETGEGEADVEIETKQACDMIRMYLDSGKYTEAFGILRTVAQREEEFLKMQENFEGNNIVNFYIVVMKMIYSNIGNLMTATLQASDMTEEDLKRFEALKCEVNFLSDAVGFLQLIHDAFAPMKDLLESVNIGDVQEAVAFFVAAYQFNLDGAAEATLDMMTVMQSNEQERKNLVLEAFRKIYLETDSKSLMEHASKIADRLIHLLQIVPVVHYDNLKLIVGEWTSKGLLDNSVIDVLWQYFTRRIPVSEDKSRAALHLIGFAAVGRRTIISRNVQLIHKIVFEGLDGSEPRGKDDMLLMRTACEVLALVGMEKRSVTDREAPFKISPDDEMWKHAFGILDVNFEKPVRFYNKAASALVFLVFKVCEAFIDSIVSRLAEKEEGLQRFILIRIAHLFGELASRLLDFLDETVYKELKRRHFIREERKEAKKSGKEKKNKRKSVALPESASKSASQLNESRTNEESVLEGAQAEDVDAEFIMHVLENDVVTGSGGLTQMAPLIRSICEQQNVYQDLQLQNVSIVALLRYMMVSRKFCQNNIQLIFTILEKTHHTEIKCTILLHCSDLLERFPNIMEPWTPKIYDRLKDSNQEVRTAAFYMLSNLILRDMILVYGHIAEMAKSIVDEDEKLNSMSKHFFSLLSRKANNLYSVLPDIFSHLCDVEKMDEKDLRTIMKFLFSLIDKSKHMENLVDRFCTKFSFGENEVKCRHIAFCLSLITYTDKALARLNENFPLYKHLLHDNEVYAFLKQILANAKKQVQRNDAKSVVAEIEAKIEEVFSMDVENNPNKENIQQNGAETSVFKKPKGKTVRRKKAKKVNSDSDDDEPSRVTFSRRSTPSRSAKTKRNQKKVVDSDDSD